MTLKSVYRQQHKYIRNPTIRKLEAIFRSQQALVVQYTIDRHINSGLFDSLADENKRRRCGKRLNLVNKEDRDI
jgi:hypothetical protein